MVIERLKVNLKKPVFPSKSMVFKPTCNIWMPRGTVRYLDYVAVKLSKANPQPPYNSWSLVTTIITHKTFLPTHSHFHFHTYLRRRSMATAVTTFGAAVNRAPVYLYSFTCFHIWSLNCFKMGYLSWSWKGLITRICDCYDDDSWAWMEAVVLLQSRARPF